MVNLQKRMQQHQCFPKEIKDLQHFKYCIAQSLLLEGNPQPGDSKLGSPRRSVEHLYLERRKHGNRTNFIPQENIRKNGMYHWQDFGDSKSVQNARLQ